MTEDDLLRAIDDDPDDPDAYLVYADHLLEQGDPRGELIQVQLRLETLSPWDPSHASLARREAELLYLLRPDLYELDETTYRFRRGFLDSLELPAVTFRALAPGSTDLARLRRLVLRWSRRVTGLFRDADLAAILALPSLRRLTELSLSGYSLGPPAGRALAAADLPHLRSLRLSDVAQRGAAIAAFLAADSALPSLESLALTTDQLTDDVAVALAAWPPLSRLRSLDLSSIDTYDPGCNAIGDRGAIALLSSPHATHLARLQLGDNAAISSETALALSAARPLPDLVELDLSFTAIDDAGARALGASPSLPRLSYLDIGHTRIGDAGLAALLHLPSLSTLHLSGTPLTADGVRALLAAPPRLTSVRLVHHHLDLPASLLDAFLLRFGPTSTST